MKMVPPDRLLPDKGIDFSNPHRIELEENGLFPKRVRLGARKYAYVEEEIDEYLKLCASKRTVKVQTPPQDAIQGGVFRGDGVTAPANQRSNIDAFNAEAPQTQAVKTNTRATTQKT
jgi:hypothetical protein